MLIITGCQRSGTHTMAHLFDCAHEQIFTTDNYTLPEIYKLGRVAEASWMAAPWLKELNATVIHIIRHPIEVCQSLEYRDFWNSDQYSAYRKYIYNFLPVLRSFHSSVKKSAYYWLEWNRMIKDPTALIRIEDVHKAPHLDMTPDKHKLEKLTAEERETVWNTVGDYARHFGYK